MNYWSLKEIYPCSWCSASWRSHFNAIPWPGEFLSLLFNFEISLEFSLRICWINVVSVGFPINWSLAAGSRSQSERSSTSGTVRQRRNQPLRSYAYRPLSPHTWRTSESILRFIRKIIKMIVIEYCGLVFVGRASVCRFWCLPNVGRSIHCFRSQQVSHLGLVHFRFNKSRQSGNRRCFSGRGEVG